MASPPYLKTNAPIPNPTTPPMINGIPKYKHASLNASHPEQLNPIIFYPLSISYNKTYTKSNNRTKANG
jgi:hypothetical protein